MPQCDSGWIDFLRVGLTNNVFHQIEIHNESLAPSITYIRERTVIRKFASPGAKIRAGTKSVRLFPQVHIRLLQNIVGVLDISQQRHHVAEEPRLGGDQQLDKRVAGIRIWYGV